MQFHTVFNVAANMNKDKVYDRHDNVDRCSYVDSTRLIERFIAEGNNLNAVRAKALLNGLYGYDEALSDNGDAPVIPVYETDPAVIQPIIEHSKKTLKSRAAAKSNDDLNDDSSSSSDLAKRSPDVSEIKA